MRYAPIVALAGVAAVQAASSGSVSKVSSSIASSKPWSSASSGSYSKSGSASSIKSHHSKSSPSSSAAVPTTTITSEPSVPTTASESEYGTWVTEWETVVETIYVCPTDSSTWTFPSTYTTISTETVAPPVSTSSAPVVVPTSSKKPYHSHSGASTGVSGTGHASGSISKTIKPTSVSSPSSCPTTLTSGAYEYPHLIVPVDSSKPSTALGTAYNGTLSATVSSIFDFDIPASDAGKTCSLVFLFPELSQLETSAYAFNGKGGIQIQPLVSPATQQTTYANQPAAAGAATTIANLTPGNSYVVSTGPCPAGQRVAYEFSAVGGLELNFFEDYNPSPLGAYITTC